MKVLYARSRGYKGEGVDPHFTLGKTYIVLGVSFRPEGRPAMISIQRDSDNTPTMAELQYFDIVEPAIPGNWGVFNLGDGRYVIEPQEFRGDFWDRFHDADSEAEKTFQQVISRLEEFHLKSGRLDRDPAFSGLCNVLGRDPAYELINDKSL